jgi:hypothetical protein
MSDPRTLPNALPAARPVQTQLVVVTALVLLYAYFRAEALLWGAAGLGLSFVALPAWGRLFARGWDLLGAVLGKINGTLLLGALFFLVLAPVAWAYRLRQRNPLFLRRPKDTLWHVRGGKIQPEALEVPW